MSNPHLSSEELESAIKAALKMYLGGDQSMKPWTTDCRVEIEEVVDDGEKSASRRVNNPEERVTRGHIG